ncbi:Mov34/MPN/PAD-1 family protein [Cytobacillus oceanisediminis]|uniref:Mov34/MPN/PAD-1 family protein n=1 Tax=Cytobacillus oceanisediminis TaxID=665099 RepID=UPI00203DF10B|nr:Mov34/MPN/PAD-1 family protein [Cytobacillus oceanisediminis]MCM3393721.1 Mov34/MPN/PAD-1 family protein [Cytobacillus oceanisediminis]
MSRYIQVKWDATEAGGILIGRILEEDGNYIIDDVTEPMPSDRRKRTRFSRKPDGHQEYFNEVWNREKGRCFYLGEWHTHPEKKPTPSFIDKEDWSRLMKMEFESGCLFFIIIGIDEIKVWYGAEDQLIELKRRS